MEFMELLRNHLLVNALAAWAVAQVLKTVIHAVIHGSVDIWRLMGDGGMPSGHSATVTAMATTAAMEYGLGSPWFAVTTVLAVIVMHDAMGVRLEASKHAKALNDLFEMFSSDLKTDEKLKEFLGHTPIQVCAGAVLGLVVALILG